MRPERIRLVDFRSYGDLDFDIPVGCTAIVGANGSGKSSLMDAVAVAIFGPASRSLEPYVRKGSDSMLIELELEHGDHTYRIRRGWKRSKSTLDFERQDGGGWTSLTQGNAADSQALIESTLGLNRATYMASAYLAQRESDSFTAAQPRDRKRVLADALALDDWAVSADRVAADRRAAEKQAAELDARIVVFTEQQARAVELEAEADRLADLMGAAREVAEQAEAELVEVTDRVRQAEQAEQTWQSRQQALEVAAARLAPLKDTAGQAALATDRAKAVQGDISRLEGLAAELEQALVESDRLARLDRDRLTAIAERERLLGQAADLMGKAERLLTDEVSLAAMAQQLLDKLEALDRDAPTCDRCGQEVHGEARERAAASLDIDRLAAEAKVLEVRAEREGLAAQARDLDERQAAFVVPEPVVGLALVEGRIAEIASAPVELAGARERLAGIEALIERATEEAFVTALQQAEHDHAVAAKQAAGAVRPEGVDLLRAAAVSARAAAEMARQKHTNAQVEHARVVAQADQLAAAAVEHEAALAQREHLRDELDVLAGLEKAFGRDGVPAWIVEAQAVPAIEAEANRVLARLGGKVERVELRTEKETKKGEARDALEIVCCTSDGDREFFTFSGGEKTRVEIACALGLAHLLGSRRGADLQFLAFDEPEGLDQQGTEALAEILKEIEQAGVETVMLVSHHESLRDQFDTSILVEADAGGSRVLA